MPLILPNTIANEQDADGDKLQQNFNTIQDWANQDAISRDGSTGMIAPLLLPGNPTQPLQAATKAYVDGVGLIGEMKIWPGAVEPANFMFCRGQAISRATYSALFAVLGTTYGAGDNSSTFNLPSMQGRSPMGFWPGGVWATAIGGFIGSADSTLPSHAHTGVDHFHNLGGLTGNENQNHTHNAGQYNNFMVSTLSGPGTGNTAGGYAAGVIASTSVEEQAHNHNLPGTTGAADRNLNTGAAGGSATNTNISPGVVVNFIIKVS